jgi:DNA-binding transcriptional ArsR family regulator
MHALTPSKKKTAIKKARPPRLNDNSAIPAVMYVHPCRNNAEPGEPIKKLPYAIVASIDRATRLVGMPRCVRTTFACICRFVKQADPLRPIWPTKETIADRSGADRRTIHRHLAWLVKNDLVELSYQERKSLNGRYSKSVINITRKSAELVGFLESTKVIENKNPSDKMPLGHTLTEPSNSSSQPAALINNLPADLSHLTSLGVQKMGIFKLMALATAKGKRLSDIVTVLGAEIDQRRGKILFGLLRNRISDNKDYAYIARLTREANAKRAKEQAEESRLGYIRAELKSKTFTNATQNRIYMVDPKAQFVQIISGQGSATAPIRDLAEWKIRLDEGNLLVASSEMEVIAMKNIDRIKASNHEQARQQARQQAFERFHGKGLADDGLQSEEFRFTEMRKSKSAQQVDAAIEKMAKGRAAAMTAIRAMLPKRAGQQESVSEPFLCH